MNQIACEKKHHVLFSSKLTDPNSLHSHVDRSSLH